MAEGAKTRPFLLPWGQGFSGGAGLCLRLEEDPRTSDRWPFRSSPGRSGGLPWAPSLTRVHWPSHHGAAEHGQQASPCNVAPCLCLLCFAPQVPLPPDSRCCYCHTCTTHRPSYLPLPSISPGVKVFTSPAVCLSSRSDVSLPSACVASFLLELLSCHPCLCCSPCCSMCPPLSRSGVPAVVLAWVGTLAPPEGPQGVEFPNPLSPSSPRKQVWGLEHDAPVGQGSFHRAAPRNPWDRLPLLKPRGGPSPPTLPPTPTPGACSMAVKNRAS